jgi:predicted DsbA family dithiol-disulfide isomerase
VPPIDPNAPYIQEGWKNHVRPMAEQLGLPMKRPTHYPRTRVAHEAHAFASAMGRGWEYGNALMKAYWVDDRNVGEVEVLCDVALSIGLDPVEMRRALETRAYADQVAEGLRFAEQVGITAVPSIIVGRRYLLQGFRPEAEIRRAIQLCREGR